MTSADLCSTTQFRRNISLFNGRIYSRFFHDELVQTFVTRAVNVVTMVDLPFRWLVFQILLHIAVMSIYSVIFGHRVSGFNEAWRRVG